jgi:hypothetical protein
MGLPSGLFPSGFPTKTLYTPLLSSICATCPAQLLIKISRSNWQIITKGNSRFLEYNAVNLREYFPTFRWIFSLSSSQCSYRLQGYYPEEGHRSLLREVDNFYQSTRRHTLQYLNINERCSENLKYLINLNLKPGLLISWLSSIHLEKFRDNIKQGHDSSL